MSRPIVPPSPSAPTAHLQQAPEYPEPASPQFQQHHPAVDPTQYTPAAQDQSFVASQAVQQSLDSPIQDNANAGSSTKPTYAKRGKITIVACVPCRKRKTKCDGQRPSCTQCLSRNGPCSYDMTDDQRKLTYLRDSVDQLQSDKGLYEQLLSTIQQASNEEAAEVFRRLRAGEDVQETAEEIQAGKLLSGVGGVTSSRSGAGDGQPGARPRRLQPRLDHYERLVRAIALSDTRGSQDIVNRLKASEDIPSILKSINSGLPDTTQFIPRITPSGIEGNFSSQESTFGMVKGTEMRSTHASLGQETEFSISNVTQPWTAVTHDQELIQHLLELYFTWQHCFFQSFPENLFRGDMAAGRTKYCSSMLVNAICAAGCLLSKRDGTDVLVDKFYDEASKLLREDRIPTITTVATLYLTSYVEGTKGRLGLLWQSSGSSAVMAVDLNLHLRRQAKTGNNVEEEREFINEGKARSHAFWGCFHVDQISAFTLGRLPILNVHGVTMDSPAVNEEYDQQPWHPYDTDGPNKPGARSSTFRSCADLSMIVNGTLQMFFAPTVPLSGSLLIEEYQKYTEWRRNLPAILSRTEDAPPHVLSLHMYYHVAVLLLFRPFLKAKVVNQPNIVPRDIARQSADRVSEIWEQHKKLYGYSGIYMFQVHCLLTACTIHIICIPSPTPAARFRDACNAFQDLSPRHDWARSALNILRNLAEKWNLILPKDAEEALYRNVEGRPHSPDMQTNITPPTFTQPTNPASALAEPLLMNETPHATFPGNSSNIDPALSTASPTVPIATVVQSGAKRTASQASPPHISSHNPSVTRSGSFSLGQKRPRMIATAHGPLNTGPASAPFGQQSPGSPASNAFAQQLQRPVNYLYSPLANHPAPLLQPVRHEAQQGASSSTGQRHQQQGQMSGSVAPIASMQASIVKQESDGDHGTTHAAKATAAQSRARSGQQQEASGGQHRSSGSNAAPAGQSNLNVVEGLSFSDDFRDPFMGFLEVD